MPAFASQHCILNWWLCVQGRPGVGKTTVIREMARLLSDTHNRRVVIVDTSNEIGGDGDIAHAGIGRARRMQVSLSWTPDTKFSMADLMQMQGV